MKDLSSQNATLGDIATYQAGVLQSSAQRVIKKFTDDCLKQYGITTMQWFMVGTIYDTSEHGMRISELADKLNTNLPYITNTINLLESKQIVERFDAANDGRGKKVRIAKDYVPKCTEIEETLRKQMRASIYARISPEQLRTYLLVLQQLSQLPGA